MGFILCLQAMEGEREEKRGRRREGGEEREESDQSAEVNNVTVRITSSPCFGA